MSSEYAIKISNLSKSYQIYSQPRDRLKQFLLPKIRNHLGLNVRQYFREFWALKNVSFEVKKGETVGIIGRNGCGKSTLLQIICGTVSQTEGDVFCNGRIAALLELGSGFNPEFSGRENVYLNGSILGLSKDEIQDRFDQIISFADIGDFLDQPVKTYSSGMMMRLAFAVAVNADPDILIIDEALSVGDELFQRKCFSRIESIRAAGATILFVSHSGHQVIDLCDRAILLDGGEQLLIGTPKAVVNLYHKFLYAPMEQRTSLREAIRSGEYQISTEVLGQQDDELSHTNHEKDVESMEAFDPLFKSKSAIEYEEAGAFISDPKILNFEGRQLNTLVSGEFYRFQYRVLFKKSIYSPRFGMLIKSTSGSDIGGASLAMGHEIDGLVLVNSTDEFLVQFSFKCLLTPGVYFINAGVLGDLGGGETYLHRIIDSIAFRVVQIDVGLATSIVDFQCKFNYSKV